MPTEIITPPLGRACSNVWFDLPDDSAIICFPFIVFSVGVIGHLPQRSLKTTREEGTEALCRNKEQALITDPRQRKAKRMKC